MTFEGHFQGGKVVFDVAPSLADGTPVIVMVVEKAAEASEREIPSLYERMKEFVGSIDGMPADLSDNIDHYLYGHPKK